MARRTAFHQSQLTEACKNNEFIVIVEFVCSFFPVSLDSNCANAKIRNMLRLDSLQTICKQNSFVLSIGVVAIVVVVESSTFHVCIFNSNWSLNLLRVWDALHKRFTTKQPSISTDCTDSKIHWCHIVKWRTMLWAVDTKLKRMTYTHKHFYSIRTERPKTKYRT